MFFLYLLINIFFLFSLRRISKLSPLAQLKVQFCQKLIEGRSSMLQGLGNVVNCNEVTHLISPAQYILASAPGVWEDGAERAEGPQREKIQAWTQAETSETQEEETQHCCHYRGEAGHLRIWHYTHHKHKHLTQVLKHDYMQNVDTMFLWNTKGDVSVTLLIAPLFGSYFLTVLFLFEGQQLCRWGCPSWDNSRGAGSKWWRLLLWRYSWRWRIRVWRTLDIVTRWIFLACPSHWSPGRGCG